MADVWCIAKSAEAQRRVLFKASSKQASDIRDLMRSLRDARQDAGLPLLDGLVGEDAAPAPAPMLAIADREDAPRNVRHPLRRASSAPALAIGDGRTSPTPRRGGVLPRVASRSPRAPAAARPFRAPSRTPRRSQTGRRSVTPSRSPRQRSPNCRPATGSPQLAWAFGCTTSVTSVVVQQRKTKTIVATQARRTTRKRKTIANIRCVLTIHKGHHGTSRKMNITAYSQTSNCTMTGDTTSDRVVCTLKLQ